jgi:hypothetical protein
MADTPDSAEPCWCTALPILPVSAYRTRENAAAGCFCPRCLRAMIDAAQDGGKDAGRNE